MCSCCIWNTASSSRRFNFPPGAGFFRVTAPAGRDAACQIRAPAWAVLLQTLGLCPRPLFFTCPWYKHTMSVRDAPRFHHECTASTFMTPTHVTYMVHACSAAVARATAKAARKYAHARAISHRVRENTLARPAVIQPTF